MLRGVVSIVNMVGNYVRIRINGGVYPADTIEIHPALHPSRESVPDFDHGDSSLTNFLVVPMTPGFACAVRSPSPSGIPKEFCQHNEVTIDIDGRSRSYSFPIPIDEFPLAARLILVIFRGGLVLTSSYGAVVWSDISNPGP